MGKYYISLEDFDALGDWLDENRKKSRSSFLEYQTVDRWLRIKAGISALSSNSEDDKGYPYEIIDEHKLTVFLLKYL